MRLAIVSAIIFSCLFSQTFAGSNNEPLVSAADGDLEEMSIDDLMHVKVSVASSKPTTINQAAGIVTLITAEDIAHMGARDLIDVLQFVPGFSFGTDVLGAVGPGFRGLWAYEGKALLIVDNEEFNDALFGNVILGRRFPVSLIDRIEIIRGPGSVKYGGNAELVVIKVTTKLMAQAHSSLSAAFGVQKTGSPESSLDAVVTNQDANLFVGILDSQQSGNRSDNNLVDSAGASASLQGNSNLSDSFYEGVISTGRLTGQVFYDRYTIKDITGYGPNLTSPIPVLFSTFAARVEDIIDVSSKFQIKVFGDYKFEVPWKVTDGDAGGQTAVLYNRTNGRMKLGLQGTYDPSETLNFRFGYEYFVDSATDASAGGAFAYSGKNHVQFTDDSLFAESTANFGWADFTLGARFENNTAYGDATVPRLAIVKSYEDWGYKALLSEAFRSPSVENIEASGATKLKAETTTVAEIELNRQINDESMVAFNLFSISIADPIAFSTNNLGSTIYKNFTHEGSDGVELSYHHRNLRHSITATYSFARPDALSVGYYQVAGHKDEFLGIASQKATLLGSFKIISDEYQISPALIYIGPRWSYEYSAAAAGLALTHLEANLLLNLVLEKKNFLRKDMSLSFGAYNLLSQDYRLPQPYQGGHSALPTEGLEYLARLSAGF